MIRTFFISCLIGAVAFAESPSPAPSEKLVKLQLVNAQIVDCIQQYRALIKRKVWIDAELRLDRKMTVFTERPIPRADAIALLREELRKQGVGIREVGDSEVYVSRVAP